MFLSIALGLIGVAFSYSGMSYLLPNMNFLELSWIRLIMAVLGIFISTTEEIMMRGFFMTQFQRGSNPTWIQIIASGICSALYHSLHSILSNQFHSVIHIIYFNDRDLCAWQAQYHFHCDRS